MVNLSPLNHTQLTSGSFDYRPPPWFVGLMFFIVIGWLGIAATRVQIEYYDGFSAIANSRYLIGATDRYIADRAPMMALFQTPAEFARIALRLHPLDVRPNHLLMALLHGAYIITVYRLLTGIFGNTWVVLVAWLAAIPNFVFVSYSPFVSHDIAPGVLLLIMLICCDRFCTNPSYILWTALVALGAVAALVKQTFGIFWILLLVGALFRYRRSSGEAERDAFVKLAYGAVSSGVITWFVLGCLLRDSDPHSPLLMRPWHNLQYLASVYEGKNVTFPWWIYVRNSPSYGWLAMLLVVPGLGMALRGTRLQQSIAIAWMGGVVFLHLMPLREVRYMAFLCPLTACLLVPAFRFVAQRRVLLAASVLLLALDVGRSSLEALQVFHPFYTSGVEKQFFSVLDDAENRNRPVFVNAPMMNFAAPISSPFAADRYHRIFHFGFVHLHTICGCHDVRVIADEDSALFSTSTCPEGSLLFYTSQILARGPSWWASDPVADGAFYQCAAICRSKSVRLSNSSENEPADATTVDFVRFSLGGDERVTIQGGPCAEKSPGELLPVLRIDSAATCYSLRRVGQDSYTVSGIPPTTETALPLAATIRRFEIHHCAGTLTER